MTQSNAQAGPTGPSRVLCGTANLRTGWPFDSACADEEVTRTGATAMLGPNRAIDGGIRGQEMNKVNAPPTRKLWNSAGPLRDSSVGQVPFLSVHLDTSPMLFLCGRKAGLGTIALREVGTYIFKFQMK